MISSDFTQPVTGNLAARLNQHFGPAAASAHNFWRLKHGCVHDKILGNRAVAISSVVRLQQIADQAGVVLEDWTKLYRFVPIEEGEPVPEGWANKVVHSGATRECLPKDPSLFDEISALREMAAWRPAHDVDEDMRSHFYTLKNDLENRNTWMIAHDMTRNFIAELIDDEVYVQTSVNGTYQFPNLYPCNPSEYYSALARSLDLQKTRVPQQGNHYYGMRVNP